MELDVLKRYNTQFGLALCLAISGAWAFPINQAHAQITPDTTLPTAERSLFDQSSGQVNGEIVDLIKGGAIRDINLFHSFLEFNVSDGQRVYFANPAGIQNILSRVTGANPSNILGTLGVDGGANLFLINPNGILFGNNAKLDVSGSFVGTTADGIGFGDQGVFSASNPEPPSPLLTVNPNVFFFNQIPGNINTSQAKLENLAVNNLLLIGGDIEIIEDSNISTNQGGNILLAGLGAPGEVALTRDGDKLGLEFPNGVKKGNVVIKNSAIKTLVPEDGNIDGGDIRIIANSIEVETSNNDQGIITITDKNGNKSGDIIITADNSLSINSTPEQDRQGIFTITEEEGGEAGQITIDAGSLTLNNSQIGQGISTINDVSDQNGGVISITTDSLVIIDPIQGSQDGGLTLTDDGTGEPGGSIITNVDAVGGNITIRTTNIVVSENQGTIQTDQANQGQDSRDGDVSLDANGNVNLADNTRLDIEAEMDQDISSDNENINDIFANTETGKDENIAITLQGLLRNFRLQEGRTPFNDIYAISFTDNSSLSGLLEINGTLNSTQDPGNLPISLVNPSQLIVANCPSSGKVALTEPNRIEKVASTPTSEVSYLPMKGKRRSVETPTASRPKKIVEAQGWTVGEDGTIILTAESCHYREFQQFLK
ncbi:filamentous hemagglutinin N-terminal domain-containing protein [Moorena sp. SIO3H5]|uniref:two-partner secretion domain-containing protein n=1 Tax=Moorena sp. SIO3H5 TaxID=2607834 RepID=UPI0013B617C8|nr:filamentous hemagglutinin N-terminal domain-containing protein [Moorena sp. SIO3H5]NEO71424.1 filamentous hemagglutinin N-terminal domain-containing protein [Moorena sp. SIO3H5]